MKTKTYFFDEDELKMVLDSRYPTWERGFLETQAKMILSNEVDMKGTPRLPAYAVMISIAQDVDSRQWILFFEV
jgi:hypothetical protein